MAKQATYISDGKTIEYTAASAVSVGDVVSLTTRLGIAASDIAQNDTGSLIVEGIVLLAANNNLVINAGDLVYWDADPGEVNKTNTDVPAGWAVTAKTKTGTTCLVKLLG